MFRGPDHMAMRMGSGMRARGFRILELLVQSAQPRRQPARNAAAQTSPVDLAHRRYAAERPRHERLLRLKHLIQRIIAQVNGNAIGVAEGDDVAAGHAVEAVLARRGAYLD